MKTIIEYIKLYLLCVFLVFCVDLLFHISIGFFGQIPLENLFLSIGYSIPAVLGLAVVLWIIFKDSGA
jgi:hypothetical protein